MFENEAKEYRSYNTNYYDWDEDSNEFRVDDGEEIERAYREGATDGYDKANEWHYIKDGDLPKDDIKLVIIEIDDCGYMLCNYRNGSWYDSNSSAICEDWITSSIIRWKEIVLPKESK